MRKQTKTTQGMGIRMKIFMPVLLLLILLPCLIYGTLCMTSAGYLRRTAKQDVRRFADQVEYALAMTEGDQKIKTKFTWDSSSPTSASELPKSQHSQDPDGDGGKAEAGMLPLRVFLERNFHEGAGDVRYVLVDQDYEAVGSDVMDSSIKVDHAFLDFLSERKDTIAVGTTHQYQNRSRSSDPDPAKCSFRLYALCRIRG